MSTFSAGDEVTVMRGGYPVTGVVEAFAPADDGAVVAVITVSRDCGPHSAGDEITAPAGELGAVTS